MKFRLLVLFFSLFVSAVMGLLFLNDFQKGRRILVAGNIEKIIQTDNKCITYISYFVAETVGSCVFKKADFVSVSGSVSSGLIERLKGEIALSEAEIRRVEKQSKNVFLLGSIKSFLDSFRNYCRQIYASYLPKNEAALVAGIVLGEKQDIGYDFYQKMIKSGSVHIVVASGFNLMLLSGLVSSLGFWFWKRKMVSFLSALVLLFYAILTGMEPPVFRAWLMVCLLFVSQLIGRKQVGSWILLLSVYVMLVWDFGLLWSISFQLSVAASVGLMVLTPYLLSLARNKGLEREVGFLEKSSLLSTGAVMLLTSPIIWFHFGRVSLIGLFSNVFILPIIPPLMVLGGLMLVLPSVFFVPTFALAHLVVRLIEFFGT